MIKRILALLAACLIALAGFYLSLLASAKSTTYEESRAVKDAIAVLHERRFSDEAWYLEHVTSFRTTDNWLNASVQKENACAATNFPFEILTLYPEFFTAPVDATERAAILLHEAKHLQGKDERAAYEFVWKNRKRLGWTADKYGCSEIWNTVRQRTKEYLPNLFVCDFNDFGDCTE